MPTLNFCSVGTNFISSHLSSELAVLASNSLFYLCRSNLGSCLSLSPLGWEVVREAVYGIEVPIYLFGYVAAWVSSSTEVLLT